MRRIQTADDLKAVLDELDMQLAAEMMQLTCWVVWLRWELDPKDTEPELHGPYGSAEEALAHRDEIHARSLQAAGWIAIHGQPVTEIVPVWPDEEDQ